MSRTETKFFLDFAQYRFLQDRLTMLFHRDSHSGNKGVYPVLSAYFDTQKLECFFQKVDGEFVHSKFRLRRYGRDLMASGICFIEAKLKFNQDQKKVRLRLPFHERLLNPMNWYELQDERFDELLQWMPLDGLQHICSVYYEREPFEGMIEGQHVRINFDTNLLYLSPQERVVDQRLSESRQLIPDNPIILEVKTDFIDIPDLMKDLLRSVGVEQTRVSKYAEAIVRLDESYQFPEVVL